MVRSPNHHTAVLFLFIFLISQPTRSEPILERKRFRSGDGLICVSESVNMPRWSVCECCRVLIKPPCIHARGHLALEMRREKSSWTHKHHLYPCRTRTGGEGVREHVYVCRPPRHLAPNKPSWLVLVCGQRFAPAFSTLDVLLVLKGSQAAFDAYLWKSVLSQLNVLLES